MQIYPKKQIPPNAKKKANKKINLCQKNKSMLNAKSSDQSNKCKCKCKSVKMQIYAKKKTNVCSMQMQMPPQSSKWDVLLPVPLGACSCQQQSLPEETW